MDKNTKFKKNKCYFIFINKKEFGWEEVHYKNEKNSFYLKYLDLVPLSMTPQPLP